jgi:hypothetical protein
MDGATNRLMSCTNQGIHFLLLFIGINLPRLYYLGDAESIC